MPDDKKDKTEHIFFSCTPNFKINFDALGDSEKMKEKMIRDHYTTEIDWLKEESNAMDEHILRYKSKLLAIKDVFAESQDLYVSEIEGLMKQVNGTLQPVEVKLNKLREDISSINTTINKVSDKLSSLPIERLQRFNETIEKFNQFTTKEKNIIELLLN